MVDRLGHVIDDSRSNNKCSLAHQPLSNGVLHTHLFRRAGPARPCLAPRRRSRLRFSPGCGPRLCSHSGGSLCHGLGGEATLAKYFVESTIGDSLVEVGLSWLQKAPFDAKAQSRLAAALLTKEIGGQVTADQLRAIGGCGRKYNRLATFVQESTQAWPSL